MNSLDILYTPLISQDPPKFNLNDLLRWISKNKSHQEINNRLDASKVVEKYPWDIIYPKHQGHWQFGFNLEFPEVSDYLSSAYGLEPNDVYGVVLLPVKSTFSGVGFWHSDPDMFGIRMYLENQETDNFLLIRPTVEPYITRPQFSHTVDNPLIPLQRDIIYSASLLKSNQTFYINNTRALHAINTKIAGVPRLAVIIAIVPGAKAHIENLIIKSAEEYRDHAIFWTP